MKRLLWVWLILASISTVRAADDHVSTREQDSPLRVTQKEIPIFPRSLLNAGVTSGWSRVVVDVDEAGKLQDWLVVAHTSPEFGDAAVSAIRHWRFLPMIVHGRPVASQVLVGFDFEAKGVVVNIHPDSDLTKLFFGKAMEKIYRPCTTREIDAIPVPLVWVDPVYPADLRARGVTGSATVEFYIDETGAVRMPAVVSADFPELGQLLADAVKQWKFSPPLRRGRPVLLHASQTVFFGPDEH